MGLAGQKRNFSAVLRRGGVLGEGSSERAGGIYVRLLERLRLFIGRARYRFGIAGDPC